MTEKKKDKRNLVMYRKLFLFLFLEALITISIAGAADTQSTEVASEKTAPSVVKIQQIGRRFELTRNGQPYFIKGAGGSDYLDELVAAGGNSIRAWSSSKDLLDKAIKNGLTVCMGLRMRPPRHGADYQDAKMLKDQRDRICDEVMKLKDHPAILMWGIGNEVELDASPEVGILVWKEIEIIAKMIKDIDKNHPVITVISGVGQKLEDIKRLCPTLDAIGINSYGQLSRVPSEIKQYGWQKPYIITEFGPRGWWEVKKTAWGLPLEDTSTEKSQFYYDAYKAGIDNKPNCLGSYVFLWGNKQEKTHTWFNMFLPEGSPTEMIDTMTFLWTGKWPANRAPKIGSKQIYAEGNDTFHIYKPSSRVVFRVQAIDPDGDNLTIKWDIRKDESDNPGTGGDREERIPPIEGAIVSSESNCAVIHIPAQAGNYRVFAYVSDPSGKTATVNLPIQVKEEK
jgi:hypothetical protein